MATALIPILAPLIPGIVDLIVGLVHQKAPAVEVMGPGTGAVKFAEVFTEVMSGLAKAHAAGTLPGEIPSDALVKAVIQAVVTSMKLSGVLTAPVDTSAPALTNNAISLKPGQSLTISVATV